MARHFIAPSPVTLFALICGIVLLASGVAGYYEVSVVDPRPEGANGRAPDGMIRAVSLLNAEGLRRIGTGLVTNFTSFAPLGTVLVALLGVGVAERAGLLGAAIRALVLGAPRSLLTAVVVFAAVVSNTRRLKWAMSCDSGGGGVPLCGTKPTGGLAAAFAGDTKNIRRTF